MGQAGLNVAQGLPGHMSTSFLALGCSLESSSPPRAVPPLQPQLSLAHGAKLASDPHAADQVPHPQESLCLPSRAAGPQFPESKTVPLLSVDEGGGVRNLSAEPRATATISSARTHVSTHTGTQSPRDTRPCCCAKSLTGFVHHHTGQGLATAGARQMCAGCC